LSRQKNTRVLLGNVVDIDPIANACLTRDGENLPYDSLIVAAGSQSSYFRTRRMARMGAQPQKHRRSHQRPSQDSVRVRRLRSGLPIQQTARLADFVIVGGGPTGVELAGALGEIARQTLRNDFRSIHPEEARIILMDGSPRLLMAFTEDLARKAQDSLARLGVEVKCSAIVKNIDRDGVSFET
jgi:NADH dehydrogenase